MALSLVSLNVEWDKHLDGVSVFLRERQPEVCFLYEVLEHDLPLFEKALGATSVFVPSILFPHTRGMTREGTAVFSRLPMSNVRVETYDDSPEELQVYEHTPKAWREVRNKRKIIFATVEKEGERFSFGATHFTWTPDGLPDTRQRDDLKRLLTFLEKENELVLCGDFNAPRGGEIFSEIAQRYKDNIPQEYVTSIDVSLHRAGKERGDELGTKMVDVLFTTPTYTASNVELNFGVSDHAAVSALITKQ